MIKVLSWLTMIWTLVVVLAVKVWAKIKAVLPDRKIIKSTMIFNLGIVLTLILGVFNLCYLHNKKWPATITNKVTVQKVVENPTPKQIAKADATITEQTTIKASGTVKSVPKTTSAPRESKYTIPLTGTANTTYTDTTGATVGSGTHQVIGQANVTVTDNAATADVTINDTSQVAMTVKREQRKHEVGGYGGVAAGGDAYLYAGGYYQRNVPLVTGKKVDVAGFGRVSAERRWGADEDWEGRVEAGVKVEF
jgi:hypothetical protein